MNDIFENNKQNLLLINEIVANYRKQNFFVGSLKLSALLKNINQMCIRDSGYGAKRIAEMLVGGKR